MKVLLLNQCFYPDVVATAQQLSDLGVELSKKGHQVTVIASNRGYDDPAVRFPGRETWNGINIIRIPSLTLGKSAKWRRTLSFGSFMLLCAVRLLLLPRFEVTLALTSPPLISLLGALLVRLKGGRLFFWVMDLNPDEAIAAGWLKERSFIAKLLAGLLCSSLRRATAIIALDRLMKQRILAKEIPADKIVVLPPWSYDDKIHYDRQGREAFRQKHDLNNKFVIMYSGNHSPCHPLDTLLEAARQLSAREELMFLFVGGGSEQAKVSTFAEQQKLSNVRCLPYEPLDKLSGSLSAADLHVVVMGDKFAGIVHPSKIYNILTIGLPVLYVGPAESHVTDIAAENRDFPIYAARNGDVPAVVRGILDAAEFGPQAQESRGAARFAARFARKNLLPRMIELLEGKSTTINFG